MQRPVFFDQFELQAQLHPDRAAVEGEGPDPTVWRYSELSRESNRIANALVRAGVQPRSGTVVALQFDAGPAYVAALLGVAKAGAVFMPVPLDLPPARLQAVLAKARCTWGLTLAQDAARLQDAGNGIKTLSPEDWAGEPALQPPPVAIAPTDPCYVVYTSGSTGEPKSILGSHRGLSHFLRWELAELGLDDTVRGSWLAPITFDVSLRDILVPLMAGGTVCHPGEAVRTQPHRLLAWLAERRISLTHCVPTLLRLLNRALGEAPQPLPVLPHLRHLLVAGEPLLACDVAAWRRLSASTAEVLNLYGPSETTLAKVFLRVGEVSEDDRSVLPIGRPLPNTVVHILQDGRPCGPGEIGEICIATPYRSLGYLNDPALTAAAFVAHPQGSASADILYRSGDLGRLLPDGSIQCMGRQDGQIKLNGVRIELAEIEAVLARLPGVAQCACALHALRPDQSPLLVAYYTRPPGVDTSLDEASIQHHLQAHLPPAMMPHRVMRLASIPTTVSGKVNRKALPKPSEVYYGREGHVPAQTPTEVAVARIWGELMELEVVGVTTPFQTLGGDSLRAIRCLMRVYQDCGVEVSLKDFYRLSTVRALATHIDELKRQAPAQSIPRVPDRDHHPASAGQDRLWRLHRMGIAPTAYNLPTAYEVLGPLDVERLRQALGRVMQRHESLRTVFLELDGRAHQRVMTGLAVPLILHDLRQAGAGADERAAEIARQDEQAAFDLERGPLLRLTVIGLPALDGPAVEPAHAGQPRHVLLFNIHHIISDVWSLGILARELTLAYEALGRGAEPDWPALRLQQRDVTAWQADRIEQGHLEADRQHWLAQFATPPAPLNLPSDRPRPPTQTFRGSTRRHRLSESTTADLQALAQRQGCTPFALIQSLVKVLLHRYTGQSDLVVGTPVAGRDHADLTDQIGYFVNVLALRDTVDPERPFADFLAEAAQRAQAAVAHQAWPLDRLVAELDLPRDMSRSPLFDVMVVVDTFDAVSLELGGLITQAWGRDNAWNFSRFDLVFHFQTEGSALVLDLNYNSDLFDPQRIDRACRHFEALATSAARTPQSRLGDLELMDALERSALLAHSRGPHRPRPDLSIPALLEAVAHAHPERPAVVAGAASLTHAQLQQQAQTLASALVARSDWLPGTCVAVWARRSVSSLVALLGILRAGGIYLPLDPAYPAHRLGRILQASGCRLVLADDAVDAEQARLALHTGPAAGSALPPSPTPAAPPPILPVQALLQGDGPTTLPPHPASDAAAYMIFTSGSTGQPKGVVCRHGALVNMSLGQIEVLTLQEQDRVLQFASPAFDASLANIFMALFCGAAVVMPSSRALESAADFLQELADSRSTVVTLPPSFLRALDRLPMPGLRVLITAGEPAVVADLAHYAAHHAVFNAYGPTEATVCATVHRMEPSDSGRLRVPIGRPLPNLALQVVDARGRLLPIGIPGRLLIGGQGVALGYHTDEALTARRFFAHGPEGARVYDSGDRVCWLEDGSLDFIGRDDDQVKVAGHRIELGDVEQALRACPGVADAAVVAVDRPDGTKALAGYWCAASRVELWPSVAEFYVYDDVVYTSMATDEARNDRYRAAFARHLKGKIVLDIGTGPQAILSRLAIQAGAAHVYAVDLLESTADKARRMVQRLGLADRITVLHGDARTLELPEPADVCISEIVGAIGGSEGSAEIINRARRLLRDPSAMLPRRSVTRLCAVHLADDQFEWGFPEVAAHYVERIFSEVGQPFDLRLCVKHLPASARVSVAGVLEDLDYTRPLALSALHEEQLEVLEDGPINGLLAWLELHVDDDQIVDILENPASWLPVFIPLDLGSLQARRGDVLALRIERRLADNGLNPDFLIEGQLRREGRTLQTFRADSLHFGQGWRATEFHARLFPADGRIPRITEPTAQAVRAELAQRLPGHAIPAYLKALERLPTTVHGKVDRKALPHPLAGTADADSGPAAAGGDRPASPLESMIAQVWASSLGRSSVSLQDDFFMLGGDSIRAIQIVSRLRRLGIRADVQDLFQHPTVSALAAVVQTLGHLAEQGPVQGTLPLSPIQRWLLAVAPSDPHRFLQAVALRSPTPLPAQAVQQAVRALWQHHDGLRLQVGGWPEAPHAWIAARKPIPSEADGQDEGLEPILLTADVRGQGDGASALEQAVEALHARIRLEPGRALFGALLAQTDHGDVVLLSAHHFVVDRVSWEFLLEDFEAALEAAEAGHSALLPFKSSSVVAHADFLRLVQTQDDIQVMQAHARALGQAGGAPGLAQPDPASNRVHTEQARIEARVARALSEAARAEGVSLEDLLLAGLATALDADRGAVGAPILVDLESHGRTLPTPLAALAPHHDLSRTVGWFTTYAPLALPPQADQDLWSQAREIKARREAMPHEGWSYPLVRWMDPGPGPWPDARIGFNHLGTLGVSTQSGRFEIDWSPPGTTIGPETGSSHDLEVLTLELEGAVEISMTAQTRSCSPAQVSAWLQAMCQALMQAAAEPGFTHAVSAEELDDLLGLD